MILYYPVDFNLHVLYLLQIISFELVYIACAYYFLTLSINSAKKVELYLPIYLRLALLFFSLIGLTSVIENLTSGQMIFYGGILLGEMPIIWSLPFYCGIILLASKTKIMDR